MRYPKYDDGLDADGYLTMRFKGVDIHKSPDDCALKVFEVVYGGRK